MIFEKQTLDLTGTLYEYKNGLIRFSSPDVDPANYELLVSLVKEQTILIPWGIKYLGYDKIIYQVFRMWSMKLKIQWDVEYGFSVSALNRNANSTVRKIAQNLANNLSDATVDMDPAVYEIVGNPVPSSLTKSYIFFLVASIALLLIASLSLIYIDGEEVDWFGIAVGFGVLAILPTLIGLPLALILKLVKSTKNSIADGIRMAAFGQALLLTLLSLVVACTDILEVLDR